MFAMSGTEKCRMYKETQSSISKVLGRGLKIEQNVYMNQIVLIKKDAVSNDETVRKAALEMLNYLLHLNIEEIEIELIKTLHDTTVNKSIQNCVLKSIKQKVVETILENKYKLINILSPWRNQNTIKLINIIEDVCVNDVPKDKCKIFFINIIIPTMMTLSTNNQIRDVLIDIAFMVSTILPISDLNSDELELFLKEVNVNYVLNIGDLRDKDYANWHNLWIFLVRFCDKHIHYSMDLTNRLLRVVEFAFRNSSIQQRLKGYDCWKELIDNASLDMNHMCSARQIKLLITPLKAKFSKQEVVICKRFDVFTYLLERLQHKAVLCLTEFFEFCFGPVGDNKDASKTGQGKSVPQLLAKSTKVLVEIIGHSHGRTVSCLSTEDVIKLEKPVINSTNISNYYKVVINSVGECCGLLKEVDIESKRETVIKCVWKSVFDLIIATSDSNRKKYFYLVAAVLDNYLTQSRENPYFEDLLILIFSVLMSYDAEFVYEVIQYVLKQLLTILFTMEFPLTVVDKFKSVLTHWFSKIFMVENKLNVLKELMELFVKTKPIQENVTHAAKIWLCLANELVTDLSVEQVESFDEFNIFFMWPAQHLHHLDDGTKKQTVLHWMKLYRKITANVESKKLNVMKDLQNIFKSNPLLNPNIVSLLNVMSQFETKFTRDFVNNIMVASSQILQLPNLKTEEEQKITALVMQYFEPCLECFASESIDELVKNVCTCIEHILWIHKDYKILEALTTFMKNSTTNLKSKFSTSLTGLLLDLYNNESDSSSYNAKELQRALQVLKPENENEKNESTSEFVPPVGRSARIAHMAKSSPKSPQRRAKKAEPTPTTLRLFGKDLDTMSPLKVKGSQLNNTTPKSRKIVKPSKTTARNSPSINEEKSSDFVPIDTEVKFQPEKLSRHQREMLKKRREDIPALYQDLSQSLSQDMFSSSSSSKGIEKTEPEKPGHERKVIVEVIRAVFPGQDEKVPAEIVLKDPVADIVPNLQSSKPIPQAPIQNIIEADLKSEASLFPEPVLPPEVISEEVLQTVEGLIVPNTQENRFLQVNPKETIIEEEKQTISESSAAESKSKEMQVDLEQQKGEIQKEPYQIEVVMEEKESAKSEAEEKERRRKQKIESELQKLRMDIVGAEEFLAASRRTRKPKKLDETPGKKTKEDTPSRKPKEETPGKRIKSASKDTSVSKEPLTEKIGKKSLGPTQEFEESSKISPTKDQLNQFKDPDTPKTRRRRSWKNKLESSKVKFDNMDQQQGESGEKTSKQRGKPKKVLSKDEKFEIGEKRKRSTGDEESEDIIESSQEFHSVLTPVFNSSKRRRLSMEQNIEDKLEGKTLIQQKTIVKKDVLEIDQDLRKINTKEEEKLVQSIPQEIEEENQVFDAQKEEPSAEEVPPTEANTSQDTTVTQESSQDLTQESQTGDTETQHTNIENTQTQDTLTQSEFSMISQDIRPPVLYFDLPKKPELTESEMMMCRMDTMSICMDPKNLPLKIHLGEEVEFGQASTSNLVEDQKLSMEMEDVLDTPNSKVSSSISSSPVTVETPNRTSELLNNTLDISPINSKSSSEDDECEGNGVQNFKMEDEDKMKKEKIRETGVGRNHKFQEGQDFGNQEKQLSGLNENGEMPVLLGEILTELEGISNQPEGRLFQNEKAAVEMEENLIHIDMVSSRDFPEEQIADVLQDIENTALQNKELQIEHNKKPDMPDIEPSRPGIQERSSRLLNMVNITSPMTHRISIKKRSVSMSPSAGRIKKLMSHCTQKPNLEVAVRDLKEEDLLTFSREVPSPLAVPRSSILKRNISDSSESDGVSPCPKRKRRVNFSDPCLTSKKLYIKDEYSRDSEANPVFEECSEPKTAEAESSCPSEEPSSSTKLTETENFETEPTLEMINPLMLKKDRPIYPKLVDCKENVILILKRVTSPMFITTLMNKLRSREIKTIGDLAKQSEEEINRFPFKVPVVPNVYKALDNYYKKNIDKFVKDGSEGGEAPRTNGVEENKRQGVIKRAFPRKIDFRVELKLLIDKWKIQGTFEECLKIILTSVEKQHLLGLIRTHYKLEIKDFLSESDFKFAIKHMIGTVGVPTVLEMLTDSFENAEEESVYFDCVMKQSLEKKSLSNIWESRSLDDIRLGLEDSIARNVFSRREVVEQCLLPLLHNPNDISSYISQISVVELADIVVERLQYGDPTQFFHRILNSSEEFNTTVTNEVMVRVKSVGEVVMAFQNCITAQNEQDQHEIMVEMFKYISGKLSANTLLELHIDFLQRIPSLTVSSEM